MTKSKRTKGECTVRFEPDGIKMKVSPGTTVLDAALEGGVMIDSVCGGAGRCGRCKVTVKGQTGSIDGARKVKSLTEASKDVLACLTTVEGDVGVFVPEYSRVGVHQILEVSENVPLKELSPLASKVHLKLPVPSLKDNLGDSERLRRALKKEEGKDAHISLTVLRELPAAMRKGNWEITATIAECPNGKRIVAVEPGDTSEDLCGLAVDVGTTTVVISLIDMISGRTLATESTYNQQIVHGEDVLTRITYAEEHGGRKLTVEILETLGKLIEMACEKASRRAGRQITPSRIMSASVSGNPTMMHFLLGLETRNIRFEPYIPVVNTPQYFRAEELGLTINPEALVYICPGRSSYVGGDVLADVVASGMHLKSEITLLIDVGTNGEAVLGCKDWMVSCSCSAGPAFEGGEVSSGMRAMQGAIDRIQIDPEGEVKFHTIGDKDPRGICGSGLIDLVAGLFINGFIDRHGNLAKGKTKRIREREDGYIDFFIAKRGKGGNAKGLTDMMPGDISVREADIQNILRTKAAIFSGCSVLLKTMGCDFKDLSQIAIAGGFGHYLDIRKAVIIGLLPDVDMKKYRLIGNGALEGARLALLSKQKRIELRKIYENMTYLELSVNNTFFEEFTSSLFIPHTDLGRFPSVKEFMELERAAKK